MTATAGQLAGVAQIVDLIAKDEFEVLDDLEDFLYDVLSWDTTEPIDRWATIGFRVQGGKALIDAYRNSIRHPYNARLRVIRPASKYPENMTFEVAHTDPNLPPVWKPLSVTVTETLFCPEEIIRAITAKHLEA